MCYQYNVIKNSDHLNSVYALFLFVEENYDTITVIFKFEESIFVNYKRKSEEVNTLIRKIKEIQKTRISSTNTHTKIKAIFV